MDIYIGRQPVVTVEKKIYGYELLFRSIENDGLDKAYFEDGTVASSRVAVNALNHIGLQQIIGGEIAFINIDREMLLSSAILSIPKERFILELLESIKVDDEIIGRVIELKKIGFKFALDDANCDPIYLNNFKPIFPYIYLLKLDASLVDKERVTSHIEELKEYEFKLLAEKVETYEQFNFFMELGCDYFQGYFFAKPNLVKHKVLDPIYNEVFKLVNLLEDDSSIEEISNAFEDSPDITIQLLKFMNSSALSFKSKIRSIKHAIALLGRLPLKNWLLLILFSKSDVSVDGMRSPVVTLAHTRSIMMSEFANRLHSQDVNKDEASLVGILSLIDVITSSPMDEALKTLTLSNNISNALLDKSGKLGRLISLVVAIEKHDIETIAQITNELDFPAEYINESVLKSYHI